MGGFLLIVPIENNFTAAARRSARAVTELGRLPGEKQFADQLRIVLAEPVDKNDPKSVRKIRRIAEKLVDCALNGEPWAISQVADRIDGKATAEIQTEQRHRYVIEAPAQLTREQWIAKYSPTPEAIPALPPTITHRPAPPR
jgi:hypothetical protein